jgi:hypothetical protein
VELRRLAVANVLWLAVAAWGEAQMTADGRVRGLLVGAGGTAAPARAVLLVAVEVLDLEGKSVPKLPAKGTSIVGLLGGPSGEPVVKARSPLGATGAFELLAPAGRYGIALSGPGGKDVELLVDPTTGRPVVFDLASGAGIDVGEVSRKVKP